jgi:hypothetical protein
MHRIDLTESRALESEENTGMRGTRFVVLQNERGFPLEKKHERPLKKRVQLVRQWLKKTVTVATIIRLTHGGIRRMITISFLIIFGR